MQRAKPRPQELIAHPERLTVGTDPSFPPPPNPTVETRRAARSAHPGPCGAGDPRCHHLCQPRIH